MAAPAARPAAVSALLQRNPDSLEILPARWSAAREHVEAMCLVHLAHPESYVRAEVYQVRVRTSVSQSHTTRPRRYGESVRQSATLLMWFPNPRKPA